MAGCEPWSRTNGPIRATSCSTKRCPTNCLVWPASSPPCPKRRCRTSTCGRPGPHPQRLHPQRPGQDQHHVSPRQLRPLRGNRDGVGATRRHQGGSRCPLRVIPARSVPDATARPKGHDDQAAQRSRLCGLEGVRRQGGQRGCPGDAGVSDRHRAHRVCDPVLFLRRVHEAQRLLHSH